MKIITVTDCVKSLLRGALPAYTCDPGIGFRFILKPEGGVGLRLDREQIDDRVIAQGGLKILLVGHVVALILDGLTFDSLNTGDGSRLSLTTVPEVVA